MTGCAFLLWCQTLWLCEHRYGHRALPSIRANLAKLKAGEIAEEEEEE